MAAAKDYNQADHEGMNALMEHNAKQIAALTHLNNNGQSVEVRNMARDMLAHRHKENAHMSSWMGQRGIMWAPAGAAGPSGTGAIVGEQPGGGGALGMQG
jgi:hypothetical protein